MATAELDRPQPHGNKDFKEFINNLDGPYRDAYAALYNLFASYGLESLAKPIYTYLTEGYSADTITILLQDTPAYQERFKANEKRKAMGLPVLSPKEYLAVENAYRQVMSQAGLPEGFYDSYKDFNAWIEQDVAPTEVQSRVKTAQKLVENVDPRIRDQFETWYSKGELVAYALDRDRTAEILEKQANAAMVGAVNAEAGVRLSKKLSEQIGGMGLDETQARQGSAQVQQYQQEFGRLGAIYGEQYGNEEAGSDVFLNDAQAGETRRRLASQERAAFTGTGAINEKTLSTTRGGDV